MTIIENETTNIDRHYCELTREIQTLKAERSKEGETLRSAGIDADEQIKAGLETAAKEARRVVQGLNVSLATAERRKSDLDRRIDAGDDTVSPLEVVEADMAIRTTKGKLTPADAAVRKAERALAPFRADDHLALLAADTIVDLVDVPVLVRKRPGDVQGFTDAVVLSQVKPTQGYGTSGPSGRVQFSEIGTAGLDLEALKTALQDTGADVQVHPGVIDYEVALWPLPRLKAPSQAAVTYLADLIGQAFDAELKRPGNRADLTYKAYDALWSTVEASLEVTEPGVARGKISAYFGIEDARPPLSQVQSIMGRTLSYFSPGAHTAAGLLETITVAEVTDAGPWLRAGEVFMAHRDYSLRFGLSIDLGYVYEPVEEV
jgi:hypothetical protein